MESLPNPGQMTTGVWIGVGEAAVTVAALGDVAESGLKLKA